MAVVARPPMDRFMGKIAKVDGHWMWTGVRMGLEPHQYGSFRPGTLASDPHRPAHVWIYEQLVGPIKTGLQIDHVCKVKLCCNPEHLEAVTPAENHRRKRLKVCRSGRHDLTIPANVRWDELGRRRGCLPCRQEFERNRSARRKR